MVALWLCFRELIQGQARDRALRVLNRSPTKPIALRRQEGLNMLDWWLLFGIVAGYLVSRISERNLRWRVFGFFQIIGMAIWLMEFVLQQAFGSLR